MNLSTYAIDVYDAANSVGLVPLPNHAPGAGELISVPVDTSSNPAIKCLDGSAPVFYIDRAISGTSNKWVFYVQGGGSCTTAEDCVNHYVSEYKEMSSHWAPESISGNGILSPSVGN